MKQQGEVLAHRVHIGIELFAKPWRRGVLVQILELKARFVPYTCLGVFDVASCRNPSISAAASKALTALDDLADRLAEGGR